MKAKITNVSFDKEVEIRGKILYQHNVWYNDKKASYLSAKKEQTRFIKDVECEFTETEREYNGVKYYNVKPVQQGQSNYSKAAKKEQSRYSGFAVSYVKDLIIAGKIDIKQWESASEKIFNFMVKLDKTLEA